MLPGAPLRDPDTGSIIGTSPFMDSLIVIISLLFFAAGVGLRPGRRDAARQATTIIDAITKSWAGLAGLLLLFLLIAQFIAYFNYSNMAQIAAVKLGDLIEAMNIGTVWLLLIAIVITLVVGIIIPQAIAKWALLAPIFIPLFLRLGVEPETVLAAYRVGDSPINIVTPIMAYFPLIVVFAARYDKRSGIGTVIALMLPYFVAAVGRVDGCSSCAGTCWASRGDSDRRALWFAMSARATADRRPGSAPDRPDAPRPARRRRRRRHHRLPGVGLRALPTSSASASSARGASSSSPETSTPPSH